MKASRRDFLTRGATVAAGLCLPSCRDKEGDTGGTDGATPAPERDPEPPPWDSGVPEETDAFAWGVQMGDATDSSVVVSLWTTEQTVRLQLVRGSDDWEAVSLTEDLAGEIEVLDGRVRLTLDGLASDTVYSLVFTSADGSSGSRVARFRTALGSEDWRVVTLGATSCFEHNQPWPSLSFAAQESLDLFCLLGDTVYADEARDLEGYRAFWSDALQQSGLADLTASTSVVATWDDHEVDNAWMPDEVDEDRLAAAMAAFSEALPRGEGGGEAGIYRRLSWGMVLDLFVLDCRGERRDGRYISEEQMSWLKAALSESTARFKVVLNSVPITDLSNIFGTAYDEDRWQGFPEQRAEILEFLADESIGGVLWLAGDVHYGCLATVDDEGGVAAGIWEVFAGPAGSAVNVGAQLFEGHSQYPVMILEHHWTQLRCDPGTGVVTVRWIGDDGTVLDEVDLEI